MSNANPNAPFNPPPCTAHYDCGDCAAYETEMLRQKELEIIAHTKGGWGDGCMCQPCIFVRTLVTEQIEKAVAKMKEVCSKYPGIDGIEGLEEELEAVINYFPLSGIYFPYIK